MVVHGFAVVLPSHQGGKAHCGLIVSDIGAPGAPKLTTEPSKVTCEACQSVVTAQALSTTCPRCRGEGEITVFRGPGATNPKWKECPTCEGSGVLGER